jgi:ubiquitin-protein ligase
VSLFRRGGFYCIISDDEAVRAILGVPACLIYRHRARLSDVTSPRLRRLAADYEAVRAEFSGHPHVRITPLGAQRPPEAYRVVFRVRGLRLQGDAQPVVADEHTVDITLPLGYPREQPYCVPLTSVFHPNIKAYYCIGDHWAAGQPLIDTIVKLADMIQYRTYNVKSPLDAVAATWAHDHPELFPVGNVALGLPEVQIELRRRTRADSTTYVRYDDQRTLLPALAEGDASITLRTFTGDREAQT